MTTVLVDQPTAMPTRKVAAVGIAGLLVPIIGGVLAAQFPQLSEACGGEVSAGLAAWGMMQAQGLITFATGYKVRNAA
jgi:hypothetical protein